MSRRDRNLGLVVAFGVFLLTGCSSSTSQETENYAREGFFAFTGRDYERAAPLLERAALRGHLGAQIALGDLYGRGLGVAKDAAAAVRWRRMAAKQGDVGAQAKLASAYWHGRGAPQDFVESARWARLAADQGESGSQFMLALQYEYGWGFAQDHAEAVRWYRLAAQHEDADVALERLSHLLATSADVRDPDEALALARSLLAVNQSYSALNALAVAYAANGRYEEASRVQRKAIAIASEENRRKGQSIPPTAQFWDDLRNIMPARLELYEQGRMLTCPGPGCESFDD